MRRTLAHGVCGFLLVTTALAVLTAGPLTANAAVAVLESLPASARMLAAFAVAL